MSRHAPLIAVLGLVGVLSVCLQAQPLTHSLVGGTTASGDRTGPLASLGNSRQAADPVPADGRSDAWRDTDLSWTPGRFARKHDVYFGTVFEDVNQAGRGRPLGVLVGRNWQSDVYDLGRLEFGQTYYWRIDEVNGTPDNTIFKGRVWTFTTETLACRIGDVMVQASSSQPSAGPENTIDGSGLDASGAHSIDQATMWLSRSGAGQSPWLQCNFDRVYRLHEMWVWNYNVASESVSGFGLKDVTIEYSANGVGWEVLGDFEFAQASTTGDYTHNTTVDFGGAVAQHVRITANSNWGGQSQSGLSEVRFFRIPTRARAPRPASEAWGVDVDSVLRWEAGREAAWHKLHISTAMDAVARGTALVDVVAEPRFPLASLDLGQRYYWRVDEINEAERPGAWAGDLWSFTTQEYMPVDDFESYDDNDNRIYETWIDGYDVPGNGSQIGHLDAPFTERVIVHGGSQSMPLFYDNAGAAGSEVEIVWSAPQNWVARGADTLVLHVCGAAGNDPEPLYIVIEDNAGRLVTLTHPDPGVVRATDWQAWRIAFSEFGGVGMYMTSIRRLAIGLGNPAHATSGGSGVIYIDDILIGCPVAKP